MSESTNNIEQEVEAMILAGLAREEGQAQEPDHQDETERTVIDVDLYRLQNGAILLVPGGTGNPLDTNAVESSVPSTEAEIEEYKITHTPTNPLTPTEQDTPTPPPANRRKVKLSYILVPLFLLFILAAAGSSYLFVLPFTASATVTITPSTKSLHTQTTLTIATHPNEKEVQGRSLETMSLTKSKTVAATGKGHQDAAVATGVITLYNTDSQSVTVPAGVTFTASNGVTIVTDESVTIQAAILPAVGTAITSAHALQSGTLGNIPAHTIYTRCCGSEFITATNVMPFSGGQDERNYSFIQSSDIQNAGTDLLASLTPKVTAALYKEGHTGESLVTPLCTPHTTSSADPGAEATSVTVSVTQTCKSIAYQLDSLEQVATNTLAHSANLTNYQQEQTVQIVVNGSTYTKQSAQLEVSLNGVWVYHFSPQRLTHFKTLIAGKSQQVAQKLLNHQEGIAHASIHLQRFDFRNNLPNPNRITIFYFYVVS